MMTYLYFFEIDSAKNDNTMNTRNMLTMTTESFNESIDYIRESIKDILIGRPNVTIGELCELCSMVFNVTMHQQTKRLPMIDYSEHDIIMYARTQEEYDIYVSRVKVVCRALEYHYRCDHKNKSHREQMIANILII